LSEHDRRIAEGHSCRRWPHGVSARGAPQNRRATIGSDKQVLAYNLCDGETPQADIGKKSKLDKGNLSRTIAKWIEAGVVIRVGAEGHPLHLYPLPPKPKKEAA
jgi:hypothetical protein